MKNLLMNFPHCNEFQDSSFIGIWHEESLFDIDRYWELEKDIFDLAKENHSNDIPRDIAWPITRIFSYIMMSIQAHYSSNDGFELLNITDSELHNFRERFQCVVEGFFEGVMPLNESFEIVNPLIKNT
ncbi:MULTISPECIES: Imm41 family immunity protein [Vibrio]|uniref:Imm41 family immunity protein n=1 Tax=Vibrio TaxID=662 RepID=UPI00156171C6|nr:MULTISPECIES: Imm41 family immunity protein [Vibrio]NRF65353.1 hypothetical protein [Vibrio coralliilyticus]USD33640.1 hypothetical protein J8Z27_05915 [Vibrio sp. SCSIO 43186]USD46708.1 hypothetical protein J4N38_06090 [Vibrio sp. SCSIO 43145]USD70765.1 hypothetical protein J4N41_05915 [Vibrio sp. SCSIO 43139]USD95682.1 hypothetical protein CTT30_05995 [Vibrio coralliilyticus]